jgi:hypothetical protein
LDAFSEGDAIMGRDIVILEREHGPPSDIWIGSIICGLESYEQHEMAAELQLFEHKVVGTFAIEGRVSPIATRVAVTIPYIGNAP